MIYKRNVIKGLPGQKCCNICWQLESFFLPNLTGRILPLSAQVLTNHCTARKHTDVACPVDLQSGIDLFNSLWLCSPHRSWGKRRQEHASLQNVSITMPLNNAEYTTFTGHIFLRSLTLTCKLSVPLPTLASGTLMPLIAEYSNICANSYNVPWKQTAYPLLHVSFLFFFLVKRDKEGVRWQVGKECLWSSLIKLISCLGH